MHEQGAPAPEKDIDEVAFKGDKKDGEEGKEEEPKMRPPVKSMQGSALRLATIHGMHNEVIDLIQVHLFLQLLSTQALGAAPRHQINTDQRACILVSSTSPHPCHHHIP